MCGLGSDWGQLNLESFNKSYKNRPILSERAAFLVAAAGLEPATSGL